MTEATERLRPNNAATRLVTSISAAHFVSHYYIILLPPLFEIVRADYSVSYTELGLALTIFNVVSAVLQTPAGFLVDRFGARPLLIGGLLLGACAFVIAGVVHSFWVLLAMFAVAASVTPSIIRLTTRSFHITCRPSAPPRRFRSIPSRACWVPPRRRARCS
jgi:MFS family permease